MKIAVFYNLPQGGAKRTVYEEVKYLSKKHFVDLYTINNKIDRHLDPRKFADNIFTFDYKINYHSLAFLKRLEADFNNFIFLPFIHKKIARTIDNKKYDIVLCHPDFYTESPDILRFLKTPNVYYCHELLRQAYEKSLAVEKNLIFYKKYYEILVRAIRKYVDRRNARMAGNIITSSIFISNKIYKYYKKKATVIYPCVNSEIFKRTSVIKNNSITFVGGRNKIKGYDLASKVVRTLRNMGLDFELLVLGFSERDKYIDDDKMLAKVYSESFITICSAYNEPFGMTPLESMACGTPVLAVNEGGYKESIINGVTGYLLERDPNIFVEKVIFLTKDFRLYNKMSEAGIRFMKEKWTWEKHGQILVNHMKKCIKENKYIYG